MGINLGSAQIDNLMLGTSQVDAVYLGADLAWPINPTGWQTVGNVFDFGFAAFDICSLDATTIAVTNASQELRTYSFDGTDWTQTGSTYTLPVGAAPNIGKLNSTRVGIWEQNNNYLEAFDWNGSNWASVGSAATPDFLQSLQPVTGLSSTDLAAIILDFTTPKLTEYSFNGSTWSQVSNEFSLGGSSASFTVTKLASDLVALFSNNAAARQLRTCKNTAGTWAQLGNSFAISGATGSPSLAGFSNSRVGFIDSTQDLFKVLDWDGTDWTQVLSTAAACTTNVKLRAMSSTRLIAAGMATSNDLAMKELVF